VSALRWGAYGGRVHGKRVLELHPALINALHVRLYHILISVPSMHLIDHTSRRLRALQHAHRPPHGHRYRHFKGYKRTPPASEQLDDDAEPS
jgi:hypothetical protein